MLLSVIIPVYNVCDYVANAFESVARAATRLADAHVVDDADVEVILVDDGSTDGSGSLVDALAARMDFPGNVQVRVLHQPNQGVSVARNVGLELATGAWVAFLDADDTWHPDILVREMRNILMQLDADAVVFSMRKVNEKGIDDKNRSYPKSCVMTGDALLGGDIGPYGDYIWSSSDKLYRRSVIEAYRLRFRSGMRLSEDSLFAQCFMSVAGRVIVDSEFKGYNYLMRTTSATHTLATWRSQHDLVFFEFLYPRWLQTGLPGLRSRLVHIGLGCLMLGCAHSKDARAESVALLVNSTVFNQQVIPFLSVHGRTWKSRGIARLYLAIPKYLRCKLLLCLK